MASRQSAPGSEPTSAAAAALPPNVHVSRHPCLRAKLSQLRSAQADGRSVNTLVHEIALIVGCEALAVSLESVSEGQADSILGLPYDVETVLPTRISLVPILRSGLGMVDAVSTLLPEAVPVHHLGLFREPVTLQPVEYYNNLPFHSQQPAGSAAAPHLAIILDPIIATGGTAVAAIQTLREWGVTRIVMLSVLASAEGVVKAAHEWDKVDIWVGGVDAHLNDKGMIVPGVGDVGDRLFRAKGK